MTPPPPQESVIAGQQDIGRTCFRRGDVQGIRGAEAETTECFSS
jgi:hypothetical protein